MSYMARIWLGICVCIALIAVLETAIIAKLTQSQPQVQFVCWDGSNETPTHLCPEPPVRDQDAEDL